LFFVSFIKISNFRSEEIKQYCNDPTDFLLNDIHTSNSCSTMTSPLIGAILSEDYKRKRNDNDEIEDLLNSLIDKTIKRQKI